MSEYSASTYENVIDNVFIWMRDNHPTILAAYLRHLARENELYIDSEDIFKLLDLAEFLEA